MVWRAFPISGRSCLVRLATRTYTCDQPQLVMQSWESEMGREVSIFITHSACAHIRHYALQNTTLAQLTGYRNPSHIQNAIAAFKLVQETQMPYAMRKKQFSSRTPAAPLRRTLLAAMAFPSPSLPPLAWRSRWPSSSSMPARGCRRCCRGRLWRLVVAGRRSYPKC